MSKTHILAIDLGSTSFKARIFSSTLEELSTGSHKLSYLSRDKIVELAIAEVDTALHNIIRDACEEAGITGDQIAAVGVSSQAQTFTLLDAQGNAAIPFISWEDTRHSGIIDEVRKNPILRDYRQHSGLSIVSPSIQLVQLRQLHVADAIKPGHRLVPLPSYLMLQLSGVLATDDNLACMGGLFSLDKDNWHDDYLEFCGLSREQVPQAFTIGSCIGETTDAASAYGLPPGIAVHSCGNDQTGGAMGAALEGHDMLLTLGSAQVLYNRCDQMPEFEEGSVGFRGPYPGTGAYELVTSRYGGNLISRVVEQHPQITDFNHFFQLAESSTAPRLEGLQVAGDGSISWSKAASAADIAYSTLQYLCATMKERYDALIDGQEPETVLIAGGGTQNPLWVRMLRDVLNRELQPTSADPLLGVARMITQEKAQ